MSAVPTRLEAAYWLALAFRLEREPRRNLNGLVLTADRLLKLGLSALVELEPGQLPEPLRRYAEVHQRLIDAEGKVSAQAFVVDQLVDEGIQVVPITAAPYPAHLARTLSPTRAPTLLLAAGNLSLLKEPGVAVCGSREAGAESLAFARAMGRTLAQAGVTLVSGLARGSDREAVEGALEAGGRVIGVAAEGILHSSARKRREVSAGRLTVVSEFAPNEKWSVGRAMGRNLTIAGLSRALVVADCVAQGGTTDQVEVGRALAVPVFVRRGKGEGALVAELARLPGVSALEWDDGPVQLPELLGGKPQLPGVRCEVRRELGRWVLHLEAPGSATLDDIQGAVREAWQRDVSLSHTPMPAPVVAEPEPGLVVTEPSPEEPSTPPASEQPRNSEQAAPVPEEDEKLSRIRSILLGAASEGRTFEQLREAVEGSEKALRKQLKLLEERGEVITRKKPRPHRYFLQGHLPVEAPAPAKASTRSKKKEQAVAPAEGASADKPQLGLVF
jgi:hypothetical protein